MKKRIHDIWEYTLGIFGLIIGVFIFWGSIWIEAVIKIFLPIIRWLVIIPVFGLVRNFAMVFVYYFLDLNRFPLIIQRLLEYPLHGAAAFIATLLSVIIAPSYRTAVMYVMSTISIAGNILVMCFPEAVNVKYNIYAAGVASIIGHIAFIVYYYLYFKDSNSNPTYKTRAEFYAAFGKFQDDYIDYMTKYGILPTRQMREDYERWLRENGRKCTFPIDIENEIIEMKMFIR